MNGHFVSGNLRLARYLVRPAGRPGPLPGLIVCHGFPIGPLDARQSAGTFPELVDRAANDLGWVGMTFNFRGCGQSEGDFSLQGWVNDLRAAIDHLIEETSPSGIWLVGTNTGGSLATCVAADDPRVRGIALLGPRADFDDWAAQPRRFLEHAREIGAIRTPGFPRNFDEWGRELRRFRPTDAARRFAPRP
ncbi:MAG: alpha/beta fold hydrolase, partial [Ilumatobacter sp.]|nr:alpha/beta fold hydrolase [Ilumatobacter sp.]